MLNKTRILDANSIKEMTRISYTNTNYHTSILNIIHQYEISYINTK